MRHYRDNWRRVQCSTDITVNLEAISSHFLETRDSPEELIIEEPEITEINGKPIGKELSTALQTLASYILDNSPDVDWEDLNRAKSLY